MKKVHPISIALALFTGALVLLGVGFAQDEGSEAEGEEITYQSCTYEGKTFSHHSLLCMEGVLYRCDGAGTSSLWRTMPGGRCADASDAAICQYEGKSFSVGAVKKMEDSVFECTEEGIWTKQDSE